MQIKITEQKIKTKNKTSVVIMLTQFKAWLPADVF